MKALRELYTGLKSLFIGMWITIRQFFKPTVTLHYPHEALKMPKRFRGHIELVRDQETGRPMCYACTLCQKACPSDCITLEGAKMDGEKKKSVTHYVLDFTKCSLCGACVEACRDKCIQFSRDYNLAGLTKEEYVMDLFKKLEDESRRDGFAPWPTPPPPASPEAKAPVAAPKEPVPPATDAKSQTANSKSQSAGSKEAGSPANDGKSQISNLKSEISNKTPAAADKVGEKQS